MSTVQASFNVLSTEQINDIHNYSLKILQETGVKTSSSIAMKLFKLRSDVSVVDDRVYFSKEVIDWALSVAPKNIDIVNRNGEAAFSLNTNDPSTKFGVGVTNLNYQNPIDDSITEFQAKHVNIAAGLAEELTGYDLLSTPGVIKDVSTKKADLVCTAKMLASTKKPLLLLVSDEDQFGKVLDLVDSVSANTDMSSSMVYLNPITPLVINDDTVEKMQIAIDRNFPVIYSNYGMYGASAPITAASCLALLNAELLAGLVLSQLLKEGAPVVLGSLPAGFDMLSMSSIYTTQSMLLNAACAEMMQYYKIPHAGTSGSGIGWRGDVLSGNMLWMNHMTSVLGKSGMAPFVGGNFDSMVFSPEMVVYSDFIINESRKLKQAFEINDETVRTDEIKSIGSGGNFLTSELTLMNMSMDVNSNPIWPNMNLEQWQEQDKPVAETRLKERTIELINNLQEDLEIKEKCLEFIGVELENK